VYLSFEQALLRSTDIVIVNYVGQRPFGEHLIEIEFEVIDRILGNAADTIFVYATNTQASVIGGTSYHQGEVSFTGGTNYLLALSRLVGAINRTHEDAYVAPVEHPRRSWLNTCVAGVGQWGRAD
jgi:hypothetical protein